MADPASAVIAAAAASLVAWTVSTCDVDGVEVDWLGVSESALPAEIDDFVWSGDPCSSRPNLRLTVLHDQRPVAQLSVSPGLTLWQQGWLTAEPVRPGEAFEPVRGRIRLDSLASPPLTELPETVVARRALREGEPLTQLTVQPPVDARRGAVLTLELRRGPLVIATEGRLLADARVGETVRVVNHTSRAVVRGTLVRADLVVLDAASGGPR